jgi:U3 small nucleolar RNA-associated protein 7
MLGLMSKAEPGYMEADEGEQTFKVKQQQLQKLVNIQTASYQFDLDLLFGDYRVEYTRNGSTMLLTSSQGHVSMLNWRNKDLLLEIHLKEKVRAAKFLHS